MAVNIKTVGVIGAGQMGNGIAHVCALAGYSVLLNDVSADRIKAGMATINGNMTRQVSRNAISEEAKKAALALIKPAEKYDDLAQLATRGRGLLAHGTGRMAIYELGRRLHPDSPTRRNRTSR